MKRILKHTFLGIFALTGLLLGLNLSTPSPLHAQQSTATAEAPPAPSEKEAFTVPEGSTEELIAHLGVINRFLQTQKIDSQEVFNELFTKVHTANLEIATRIFAQKPEKDDLRTALQLKMQALSFFAQRNKDKRGDFANFVAELEKLAKDDETFKTMYDRARYMPFYFELGDLVESDDFYRDGKVLREKLVSFLEENPDSPGTGLATSLVRYTLYFGAEQGMVEFINETAEAFRPVLKDEKVLASFNEQVEKAILYATLPGEDMKIEGLTLAGEKVSIESLKGKIVLVDFWATWCGPCLAEFPNMRKLYTAYKEHGFEIIGYSTDGDLESLVKFQEREKLPWIVLSATKSVSEAELEDYSDRYKVTSIPTMFLIDKEGKIVSTRARGEELTKLLQKYFPEVKVPEEGKK